MSVVTNHMATHDKSSNKNLVSRIGRIEVDRDLCIGATTCVAVSPDVFEMDDENKAIVKDLHGDTDENIIEAARACPVGAIYVFDKKGKQLWPEK